MLKYICIFVSVLFGGAQSCSQESLNQCVAPVQSLMQESKTLFDNQNKAEEQLKTACPALISAFQCLKREVDRCAGSQLAFLGETFKESVGLFKDICEPGPFQERYLKHGKCMETVNDEVQGCTTSMQGKMERYQKQAQSGAMSMNDVKTKTCRLINSMLDCAYMKSTNKCGEETGALFKEITTRMISPMLKQIDCIISGCEGLSRVNTLLLLGALMFAKYFK